MLIGGNLNAVIQTKTSQGKNLIGENVEEWETVGTVLGWLDYASGQNDVNQFNAKIQETTHYFLCDVIRWKQAVQDSPVTSENCRLVIKGDVYNTLLIDEVMDLGEHLEIYLKYVGGGLGVK